MQNGGTTVLQSGPSGWLPQLEEANYPVNVGAQQTASAQNNRTGSGTVILAFSSQDAKDQFAQRLLDAYGNYDANSATNPVYFLDGVDVCNTTTYDALIVAGESLSATNDIMQSLSSQSGLNISGAIYNLDVIANMFQNANNPQETFPTDPQNAQVDGGGTFTPSDAAPPEFSSGTYGTFGPDGWPGPLSMSGDSYGTFGSVGSRADGGIFGGGMNGAFGAYESDGGGGVGRIQVAYDDSPVQTDTGFSNESASTGGISSSAAALSALQRAYAPADFAASGVMQFGNGIGGTLAGAASIGEAAFDPHSPAAHSAGSAAGGIGALNDIAGGVRTGGVAGAIGVAQGGATAAQMIDGQATAAGRAAGAVAGELGALGAVVGGAQSGGVCGDLNAGSGLARLGADFAPTGSALGASLAGAALGIGAARLTQPLGFA
jgi:hypothetical protein